MWKRAGSIVLKATGICAAIAGIILWILTAGEYVPRGTQELEIVQGEQQRSIREGDTLEILSFNVGYAGLDQEMDSFLYGGDENTPASAQKIADNLKGLTSLMNSQTYDVLFLQEVDRSGRRSWGIDEEAYFQETLGLSSAFAQNHRCVFIPYPIPDIIGTVNSGLQTLTSLEVQSAQCVALPYSTLWPVRLCRMKHCLLVTRIRLEDSGRELVLINLHLEGEDNQLEKEQLDVLAELMRQEYEQGNYVIAGGCFNQIFPDDDLSSYPLRQTDYYEPDQLQRGTLSLDWSFVSDRSAPTRRLLNEPYSRSRWWAQYYVVDGFIFSPNVALEQVKTVNAEFRHSDHNPVKLTVRLAQY